MYGNEISETQKEHSHRDTNQELCEQEKWQGVCIKGGNQVALRPSRLERPEENPYRIPGFGNL